MIYQCTDTAESFFSAVFDAYKRHETPEKIIFTDYQQDLLTEVFFVVPDREKAQRVKIAYLKYGGVNALNELDRALRSCEEDKMTAAFRYVKRTIDQKTDVSGQLSNADVFRFQDIVARVQRERHRFTGFLRFIETRSGVYYAHYEPDNDITELIAPHFKARLSAQPFIIHDVKRNKLALYNGKDLFYTATNQPPTLILSEDEMALQSLWRTYFQSVAVKERKNKRLQDNFLPRRYRKHMVEFKARP